MEDGKFLRNQQGKKGCKPEKGQFFISRKKESRKNR